MERDVRWMVYGQIGICSLLTDNELGSQYMSSFFDRVWTVVAPERVRAFCGWLVTKRL